MSKALEPMALCSHPVTQEYFHFDTWTTFAADTLELLL